MTILYLQILLMSWKKPSIKSSLLRAAQQQRVGRWHFLFAKVSLAGLARSPGLCGPAGGTLTLSVEQPAATFSQVPHQPQLDPVPSHLRSNNPLTLAHSDFRSFRHGQDVDETIHTLNAMCHIGICKKVDSFVPRPDPDIPLDPAHRVEKKEADNRFNTGNDTYWQGIFWYIFKRPKTVIGQYRSSNLFYVLLLAHNLNHIMMAINNLCHFLSAAVLLIILILDQRWKVAGRCWVLGGSLVRHADGENEVGIGWTSKHGPMITFPLFLI